MKIYLAGAIRDGVEYDIKWREQVIAALQNKIEILNPLAGKRFDPVAKKWTMNGIDPIGRVIVKHDFWCVDNSDIVLFNFEALKDGYPNIGTLVEFGRATSTGALIYSVIDPNYTGHSNLGMFKLHPFIQENSAATFDSMSEAISFLDEHIDVLDGVNPSYSGG